MPGYLIKDTTKEERIALIKAWILLEIFLRTVMDVWPDVRICTRIILTGRRKSVRSIWNSMPDMSVEIWTKRRKKAARCRKWRLTVPWTKMK